MDKRDLKGSPSRDAFKHWHKQGAKNFYALDMDLMFVEKSPPGIAAATDYKLNLQRDPITFSEVIAYNDYVERGIPVYIIVSECLETFDIYRYMSGDWRPYPPVYTLKPVLKGATQSEYWRWEFSIREEWRRKALKVFDAVVTIGKQGDIVSFECDAVLTPGARYHVTIREA